MAGEYYRWLARDVKPEEKREMSREEKIRNWWHYHKWQLLAAVVALWIVGDIGLDILTERRNQPDYAIAYVGSSYLPEDTVTQLTEAIAALGQDLNGNGKVQVALHEYIIYPQENAAQDSNSYNMLYGAQVKLIADLSNCDSFFFLMEDPRRFQQDYEILIHMDGTYPEAGGAGELYRAWADCPVLAGFELGDYTLTTMDKTYTGSSQDVLARLYIGRRGFWEGESCRHYEGCEALWNALTQPAR